MLKHSRIENMMKVMFPQIFTTQYPKSFAKRMVLPEVPDRRYCMDMTSERVHRFKKLRFLYPKMF